VRGDPVAGAVVEASPVDVAIVGGGPAGAVLAALVARRGRSVVVLERAPVHHWRACGVFSSPASVAVLRAVGLDEATLRRVARPVPAMRVETERGTRFRLTYGDDGSLTAPAVGFDRGGLDPALLDLARSAGAEVRLGATVTSVEAGRLVVRDGDLIEELPARIVVGADGIRSVVARAFGVARPARLAPRVGLTFHVADPEPDVPRDARMITFPGGYVGLAPVPGGRVNVGIVLGRSWAGRLRANGAEATVATVLAAVPRAGDDPIDWRNPRSCDAIEGAAPLGHRVAARHGPGWLLVGDAAGFLDPFTGEGLHRALVSARLAAIAIGRHLDGDADGLAGYDRAMNARFRSKDAVSLIVQAFLARAAVFDHVARRLAARDRVRETMGLVMGDLVPASRALDPRFVAELLR
jgi:flavin-dependent dehydrogenase